METALALLAMLLALPVRSAQPPEIYCAFEVVVKSPTGDPVVGAGVSGLDQNGVKFGTALTDAQGVVRFCDAPSGLIEINVGGNLCGAVSVGYLSAYWLETRRVFITYKRCSDDWWVPGRCLLTVRVRDEHNAPVSGAALLPTRKPKPATPKSTEISDRYGRLFFEVNYGDTLEGVLSKAGYAAQPVTAACRSGKSFWLERTVVLRAAP
jgi:hypothetical protein